MEAVIRVERVLEERRDGANNEEIPFFFWGGAIKQHWGEPGTRERNVGNGLKKMVKQGLGIKGKGKEEGEHQYRKIRKVNWKENQRGRIEGWYTLYKEEPVGIRRCLSGELWEQHNCILSNDWQLCCIFFSRSRKDIICDILVNSASIFINQRYNDSSWHFLNNYQNHIEPKTHWVTFHFAS